jgi:uncharacterized protein
VNSLALDASRLEAGRLSAGRPAARLSSSLPGLILALWTVLVLCLAPLAPARAAEIKFPALTGRVVDDAHVLSADQQTVLTEKLKALEAKNGRQLVVVTLPSLQGQDIQDFGYQLGRKWAIGQKGQNTGVLFIIAPAEHKVRIEVGYGLEPVLTDALSSVILQDKVLPKFRDGDMAGGIMDGTDALLEQLGLDDAAAHSRVTAAEQPQTRIVHHKRGSPIGALFTLFIVFIVISSIFRRGGGGGWFWPLVILSSLNRGGGGWSDGGGGGGNNDSFGGGGGDFGGGGSSGSW